MGILLCEQNFRDVWRRNKSVRGEIGKILRTHKHTHAAKLVVRILHILAGVPVGGKSSVCLICMKYRIIILIIIIKRPGEILLSYIANTSRTRTHALTQC